jgi:hypothetical protein
MAELAPSQAAVGGPGQGKSGALWGSKFFWLRWSVSRLDRIGPIGSDRNTVVRSDSVCRIVFTCYSDSDSPSRPKSRTVSDQGPQGSLGPWATSDSVGFCNTGESAYARIFDAVARRSAAGRGSSRGRRRATQLESQLEVRDSKVRVETAKKPDCAISPFT